MLLLVSLQNGTLIYCLLESQQVQILWQLVDDISKVKMHILFNPIISLLKIYPRAIHGQIHKDMKDVPEGTICRNKMKEK